MEFNSLSRDSTPRARRSCPENTRHSLCFLPPPHPRCQIQQPSLLKPLPGGVSSSCCCSRLPALHCIVGFSSSQPALSSACFAVLEDQPRMGGLNQEGGGMAMLAGGSSRTRVCLCCLISAGQFQLVSHHRDHEMAINSHESMQAGYVLE